MSVKLPRTKRQKISYAVKEKSDIIVSFDEEYLDPVISQKKTYDFRSWKADSEVKKKRDGLAQENLVPKWKGYEYMSFIKKKNN